MRPRLCPRSAWLTTTSSICPTWPHPWMNLRSTSSVPAATTAPLSESAGVCVDRVAWTSCASATQRKPGRRVVGSGAPAGVPKVGRALSGWLRCRRFVHAAFAP